MDADRDMAARTAARQLLRLSVAYLAFMYLMLFCIDVLDWWPGAGLPFQENVQALMGWSMGLMIASIAAMLLLCPLLFISALRLRKPALGVLVALQVFALCPFTCYLRWYDAFGVGV